MQGSVVRSHFDAFLEEHSVDEIVSVPAKFVRIDLNGIQMEHMFAARADGRQRDSRNITKPSREVGSIINPVLIERIEFPQLYYTHCPLNVSHAEVVAAIVKVLPPELFAHWET